MQPNTVPARKLENCVQDADPCYDLNIESVDMGVIGGGKAAA